MKEKKMYPVVHFELPANDRKRIADFYAKVFGWETEMLGKEYGYYVMAMTAESDMKGPKKPGAINGGFYEKTADMPEQHPSVVISVDDIEEHIKTIKEAGGKILGEPMDIPKVGKYVSFVDSEGNRLSIMQPVKM